MTHEQITSFLAVIEYGSLTAAAKAMYITQPSLSKRISDLENEIGDSLFVRRKGIRSVVLTPTGKRFLPIAQKWISLFEETKNIFCPINIKELHIASSSSAAQIIIPKLYQNLKLYNPTLKIDVSTTRYSEYYTKLLNQTLDFALTVSPTDSQDVITTPLAEEPLVFVCGKNSSYPHMISLTNLDIQKCVFMPLCPSLTDWYEKHIGSPRDCLIHTENFSLTQQFIQYDDIWSILPESTAAFAEEHDILRICRLSNVPPPRILYAVYTSNLDSEYRDFILNSIRGILQQNEFFSLIHP